MSQSVHNIMCNAMLIRECRVYLTTFPLILLPIWIYESAEHLPRDLLRPAFLVLHLIYCPHCPLHILHAHKALVQTEVVADSILEAERNDAPVRGMR